MEHLVLSLAGYIFSTCLLITGFFIKRNINNIDGEIKILEEEKQEIEENVQELKEKITLLEIGADERIKRLQRIEENVTQINQNILNILNPTDADPEIKQLKDKLDTVTERLATYSNQLSVLLTRINYIEDDKYKN